MQASTPNIGSPSSQMLLWLNGNKSLQPGFKMFPSTVKDVYSKILTPTVLEWDDQQPLHMGVMFGMFVYFSRRTVLHQFTCLAVARLAVTPVLLSCHRAKLRRLMRPSSVVLKLFYEKLTTEAAHACLWLHSGFKPGPWIVMTLSLNSLHVLSLLVCIQIPGWPFSLLAALNYISLLPSCLNGKTECATNCLYSE